ncbi:unnamed protein product [Phytophthora fragariaefolia]|uniref:Unnamed protein product n=1 Tax=Phytophthora fragariaefolia TaxID=1490495 RepID=A0A9W7CZF0_9STRA|nr:unnamed protein product [Phytophthora fragariaefolia]
MIKRSILALLLVLVAVRSCALADEAALRGLEELPPGVTIVSDQEPFPAGHKELSAMTRSSSLSVVLVSSQGSVTVFDSPMAVDTATAGATPWASGTRSVAPSAAQPACLAVRSACFSTADGVFYFELRYIVVT